jgi:hypothetical protein
MKLFRVLACSLTVLAAAAFATVNPQLHQVRRVYLLAMGGGMDQYLANQLTKSGLFEVVTDPKEADAILTDNVGESFQKRLDDLYPPPPKPKPVEAAKPADSTKPADSGTPAANASKTSDSDNTNNADAKNARKDPLEGLDFSGARTGGSSFGRGRGNFFVVDRKSRVVLWSVYERPKSSTPPDLTKAAERVVKRLKDDLTPKKGSE